MSNSLDPDKHRMSLKKIIDYLRADGFSQDYLRVRAFVRGSRDSKVTGVVRDNNQEVTK